VSPWKEVTSVERYYYSFRVTVLDIAVPVITILALLAVGLDLTQADFARVRQRPGIVAAGLFCPLITLPPLAVGLIAVFDPPPAVQGGLLLIAACPIGGISNTYTYLAGASVALSVTLTAMSSLLAAATIPLLDRGFGLLWGRQFGLTAPIPLILGQLIVMLALPVSVGMWIRAKRPAFAIRSQPIFRLVAFLALGALMALVIGRDLSGFLSGLRETVPLAVAFIVGSFAIGWSVARAIGTTRPDRFTLATEFATRNVAVATTIAVTLLHRVEFALFATAYLLIEIPLMMVAIALYRMRSRSQ
jgi:BASS family bile acid:Na+ symporter